MDREKPPQLIAMNSCIDCWRATTIANGWGRHILTLNSACMSYLSRPLDTQYQYIITIIIIIIISQSPKTVCGKYIRIDQTNLIPCSLREIPSKKNCILLIVVSFLNIQDKPLPLTENRNNINAKTIHINILIFQRLLLYAVANKSCH